jgi:hypothetical protein
VPTKSPLITTGPKYSTFSKWVASTNNWKPVTTKGVSGVIVAVSVMTHLDPIHTALSSGGAPVQFSYGDGGQCISLVICTTFGACTNRIRLLPESAITRLPSRSIAIPYGEFRRLSVMVPSLKPEIVGDPTTVDIDPLLTLIIRMMWLEVSEI